MSEKDENQTHILATPSPIHDVKTACGQRLGDLPAGDAITGDRDRITCEPCKAMLGEVKAKDWLQGLPEIVNVDTKDGAMEISIAHEMAGVLAGIFSREMGNYPQADNYLAFQFGHGPEDDDDYSMLVTLQRFEKLTPLDVAASAVERMNQSLFLLDEALNKLEFDTVDAVAHAERPSPGQPNWMRLTAPKEATVVNSDNPRSEDKLRERHTETCPRVSDPGSECLVCEVFEILSTQRARHVRYLDQIEAAIGDRELADSGEPMRSDAQEIRRIKHDAEARCERLNGILSNVGGALSAAVSPGEVSLARPWETVDRIACERDEARAELAAFRGTLKSTLDAVATACGRDEDDNDEG